MESNDLPIDDHNPIQLCGYAVDRLSDIWDAFASKTGDGTGKGRFIQEIFGQIWADGDTGEKFELEIDKWDDEPEELRPLGIVQAMLVSCAYACQGMKAHKAENFEAAWRYTAKCNYWLGIVIGAWSIRESEDWPVRQFAKQAAKVRHKENNEMRDYVRAWYAENAATLGTKDAAAEAAAGKLVPMKFRTIRDWLKEPKK